VNKALLTGRLLIMPLVNTIAASLFKNVAGCKLFAAPTPEFPFGMPYMCADKESIDYISTLYLYHMLKWLVIGTVAYFGKKYSKQIVVVSCATAGGILMSSSLGQLVTMMIRISATDPLEAADAGPQVTQIFSFVYYVLVVFGSMSQFMMRGYADKLDAQDSAYKKVGSTAAFAGQVGKMIKDAPDPDLKAELQNVQVEVNSFVDAAIAQVELSMSEISPIPNFSRQFMARRLKEALDKEKEGGGMPTKIWDHFYVKFDPTNTASGEALKTLNKKIWALKVRLPKGKGEGAVDEDGLVSMRTYHEILLNQYALPVEKLKGGELLFKNQVLPVIWLKFLPLPHKGLNEKHGLGKDIKKTICQPPWMWLSMFVAGPPIRNYFVFSPCGFVWAYPLIKFDLFILYVQYSGRTSFQHFDAIMSNFICYRMTKKAGIMAKQKTKKFTGKFDKMSKQASDAGAIGGSSTTGPNAADLTPDMPAVPGAGMLDVAQNSVGGDSQMKEDPKVTKYKGLLEELKKTQGEELEGQAATFEEQKKELLAAIAASPAAASSGAAPAPATAPVAEPPLAPDAVR